MTGISSKRFWFSYILFLIFVGGILVLFIYISSIASNEKINFSIAPLIYCLITLRTCIISAIILDKFFITNWVTNEETQQSYLNIIAQENYFSLSKIYNQPNNLIIILLICYLLLTLIIVVKITNLFSGPFRPMTY